MAVLEVPPGWAAGKAAAGQGVGREMGKTGQGRGRNGVGRLQEEVDSVVMVHSRL